jgi:DNA repair exonuclease SbcCD ATPase subunit
MMNWLTALKILPWGEMIDYAPKLVSGAQKLWQRVRAEQVETDAIIIEQAPQSLGQTARELQELKQQLQDMQAQQLELSNLVSELAAQNQRLVSAVDVLRIRTRILLGIGLASICACLYLLIIR